MSLHIDNINSALLDAEYAVRGPLAVRGEEISAELKTPEGQKKYSFDSVIFCNIGNPQALHQLPITFPREVLGLMTNPLPLEEADHKGNEAVAAGLRALYSEEALATAREFIGKVGHWTATGAYSNSKGHLWIRQDHIAPWVEKRDATAKYNYRPSPEEFFLTNGASQGIQTLLTTLEGTGSVMIPIPQYPLYTATLTLLRTPATGYYLDEAHGWRLNLSELERAYNEAEVKPSALVVINPGNPTGQVLTGDDIKEVLEFAYAHKLTVLADEVYQENIYNPKKRFVSFREALLSHENEGLRKGVQLASYHSTSKGVLGECGRRGGYMHAMNFDEQVLEQITKLQAIQLCSCVDGQITVAVLTNFPDESTPAGKLYKEEHDRTMSSYKRKASNLYDELSKVDGIACTQPEGAMYVFPRIYLPEKYIEHAISQGYTREGADGCWCRDLLEQQGILVTAGSGFGQEPGTYHFRTTILPPEDQIARCAKAIADFHNAMNAKYKS